MPERIKKKFIMICPASSQPRYHKRAAQLLSQSSLDVYAFERGYYEQNKFAGIKLNSLGTLVSGSLFKRLIMIFKSIMTLRKICKKDTLFYAFSIDTYILGRLAGFQSGIYEVGDIRTIDGNKKLLAFLEKWVVRDCKAVVLTSKYFYTNHYQKYTTEKGKFFVIENKLDSNFFCNLVSAKMTKIENAKQKIRIGVIGFLRYEKPLKNLVKFVEKNNENYEIVCFGDGPLREYVESLPETIISYHGSFKYPDDIEAIYTKVDVNYVVYDTISENVKLALPNKLYESIFFEKPIIVAENTALSYEVESRKVGKSVSVNDIFTFEKSMSEIDDSWISEISLNCSKTSKASMLDDGQEVIKKILED